MPNQTVGLEGKFNLGNFNAGVKRYVAGLTEIRNETLRTVSVMNGFGNAINRNFGASTASVQKFGDAAQGSFGGTAKQLHYLDQALRRGNASIAAAQGGLHGLSVAGIAVGTAVGQVAVRAIERLLDSIGRLTSAGLELVVFFERLELSLNFFSARSAQAANDELEFAEALRQTSVEAQGLLIWVRQLAITSPLTTQQVGNIFRVSQAYGLLAEEAQVLLPLLLDLGAATGLDPQTLENAARALGQIRSRGKLTGEEIRQLGNAGIPIRDILVKELGITNQEFDKVLESGALLSDTVIPAIVDSLRDFEGAAEKVAFETIGGLLSQLEEIKQIGLADFFKGVLEPIRPILEELVDFADNPEFIAGLRVIGEEIGGVIAGAIQRLTALITGLINAWRSLNPEVQKLIIVFIGAGAAITVVAGALGILFFAIQALVNPFTLLVGVLAASITAWVRWGDQVTDIVQGTVRAILRAIQGLVGFFDDLITSIFGGSNDNLEQFGEGAGDAWATGFATGSVRGANRAISALSSFLVGEMRPGSWPKFLRALDGSGEAVTETYFNEIATAIPKETAIAALTSRVEDGLGEAVLTAGEYGDITARSFADRFSSRISEFANSGDTVNAVAAQLGSGEVQEAAYSAGISASQAWVDGFRSLIPVPGDIVSSEVAEIFARIGGGRQLSRSGAEAFSGFLDGFKDADFSILNDIAGEVSSFLSSLADIGEIPEIDVPRAIFGVREAIASAIEEFRDLGSISENAFGRVRSAAGPVGEQVERILRSYQDFAKETLALSNAQEELNTITQRYDDLLDPLYAKLRQVSDERQTAEEVRELASLQRIVNSQIVTDERKRIAAAQIQEILTKQQIRNLEGQRDEEEGIAKEKVDAAKESQDAAKENLELLQAQISAQNDQLALVADEAKQIERLQDQLNKLQEKQLSALDRQLKFLGLVQSEITDSRNAARAKLTLESETSSEYEKQKATLDLQQIALQRISREASAIELGFSPSELQQYRDLLFSLEDLGIKTGGEEGGGLGEALAIDPSQLPNVGDLQKEFDETLEGVRTKIAEIKAEFLAFLVEVNAELPEFLQFFGEEGEQPPIIDTLKKMTVAVLLIGAALKAVDLAYKFIAITAAVKGLTTAIGTGAIGAALAPYLLGAKILLIDVGLALQALVLPMAIAIGAVIVFGAAWQTNFLNTREVVFRAINGIKEDIISIGDFLIALKDSLIDVFTAPFSKGGRERIAQDFADLRKELGSAEGREELLASFRQEGADYSENVRAGFAQTGNPVSAILLGSFREARDTLLGDPIGEETGQIVAQDIVDGMLPLQQAVYEQLSTAFTGIGTDLSSSGQITEAGLAISNDLTAGIKQGLVETDELNSQVSDYVDRIYDEFAAATESQSPSERSAREVGVPIAEGIALGIGSVDQTTAVKVAVEQILSSFDDLRNRGAEKFDALRNTLSAKQRTLRQTLVLATQETNRALLKEYQTLTEETNDSFVELFDDILTGWVDLGDDTVVEVNNTALEVVSAFNSLSASILDGPSGLTQLGIDIVEVFSAINTDVGTEVVAIKGTIIGEFVTNDDSIINQLRTSLFGGTGGATTSPVYSIGSSIMSGIALGITDNAISVESALLNSIGSAFVSAGTYIQSGSPSKLSADIIGLPISQGVALGILSGAREVSGSLFSVISGAMGSSVDALMGSYSSAATPSYVSQVSRTTNYNLNVNSNVPSSGLVSDFAILRSVAV